MAGDTLVATVSHGVQATAQSVQFGRVLFLSFRTFIARRLVWLWAWKLRARRRLGRFLKNIHDGY